MLRVLRVAACALPLALPDLAAGAGMELGPALAIFEIDGDLEVVEIVATPREDESGRTVFDFNASHEIGGGTGIALSGTLDPDPAIVWSVDFVNFAATPLAFFVEIVLPLGPGPPLDLLTLEMEGALTDLDGDGAFALGIDSEALLDFVPVFALGGAGLCETAGTGGLSNHSCGSFGPVELDVDPLAYTELGVNLAFTLSSRDLSSFSGSVTLLPEPSPAAVTALALLALAALRARRLLQRGHGAGELQAPVAHLFPAPRAHGLEDGVELAPLGPVGR